MQIDFEKDFYKESEYSAEADKLLSILEKNIKDEIKQIDRTIKNLNTKNFNSLLNTDSTVGYDIKRAEDELKKQQSNDELIVNSIKKNKLDVPYVEDQLVRMEKMFKTQEEYLEKIKKIISARKLTINNIDSLNERKHELTVLFDAVHKIENNSAWIKTETNKIRFLMKESRSRPELTGVTQLSKFFNVKKVLDEKVREEIFTISHGMTDIFDLHCHTRFSMSHGVQTGSDALFSIDSMFRTAKARGLRGLAVTEHNRLDNPSYMQSVASKYGLISIPGAEIASREGDILAYFNPGFPGSSVTRVNRIIALSVGKSPEEVIDNIHSEHGVAVIAHPGAQVGALPHGTIMRVCKRPKGQRPDGIEEYTSGKTTVSYVGMPAALGLASLGSSDAHETISLGSTFTMFPKGILAGSVIEAIRHHNTKGAQIRKFYIYTAAAAGVMNPYTMITNILHRVCTKMEIVEYSKMKL